MVREDFSTIIKKIRIFSGAILFAYVIMHLLNHSINVFSINLADSVRILYGGSLKPNNSKEIFFQPDIAGGLIGGASLSFEDFYSIIRSIGKN